MKYSQYNIYTSTGRPSNRFGGVNYAAMSKEDGSRKKIVSRFEDGKMLMFDYDAYHLRLIAKLIDYNFPNNISVHEYLGKQYFGKDKLTEEEYGKSKEVSFRLLYGGIDKEFENIPFFKAVKKYIFSLWANYKNDGYIESAIAGKKLYFNNVEGINPQKIFNYMIQLYETEQNMIVSEKVFKFLRELRTRFIMYTYDSFLFDVYSPEMPSVLKKLKEILESDGDFPVRSYTGSSYDDIKLINT
jgi:DNA polymerase I-like protein with 3'-5' exonuclease and polymerase domains